MLCLANPLGIPWRHNSEALQSHRRRLGRDIRLEFLSDLPVCTTILDFGHFVLYVVVVIDSDFQKNTTIGFAAKRCKSVKRMKRSGCVAGGALALRLVVLTPTLGPVRGFMSHQPHTTVN